MPDQRFKWLCDLYKPPSKVPAKLLVTDIAGLIKGASEGAGLGNAFLSHIQAVDGIYHCVRAFESDEVIHVDDSVDPCRDLETIQSELRGGRADFETGRPFDADRRAGAIDAELPRRRRVAATPRPRRGCFRGDERRAAERIFRGDEFVAVETVVAPESRRAGARRTSRT